MKSGFMLKKIILSSIIFTAGLFAQQKMDLNKSIEIGLKNSKNVKIALTANKLAAAKITQANAYTLPKLSFTAAYTRLSDIPAFEVKLPTAPMPIRISDPILNNYVLKLGIQQPLFTGFKLSSNKSAAENMSKSAEFDVAKEMNDEVLNITSAYYNLYKATLVSQFALENQKQILKHVTDVHNFFNNGQVTKNDVLKLEVQLSTAQLRVIEAKNNLDFMRAQYNQTIGLPVSAQTEIVNDEIQLSPLSEKYDNLLSEAKENRVEIKSLNSKLDAANDNITSAKSGIFPSVYFTADYYYNNPNQRIMPAREQFDAGWNVGISLNWDLWDWNLTNSLTEQAEQSSLSIKTGLEKTKELIELELYRAYLSLVSATEKVKVNIKTVEQATEQANLSSNSFKEHVVTATDISDSETALLKAKTDLTDSYVEYAIAKVKLNKAAGRKLYN